MKSLSRAGQVAFRRALCTPLRSQTPANGVIAIAPVAAARYGGAGHAVRGFHSSMTFKGLMPQSENPAPPQSEDSETPTVPTDISTAEFHERADEYLEELLGELEAKQEDTPDYDVEYSVCSFSLLTMEPITDCWLLGRRDAHQNPIPRP
jgi:frataxin